MKAETDAYLMRNDAVVVSSEVSDGWNSVQGAEVIVTDAQENTV
jgi:hypothetical protein